MRRLIWVMAVLAGFTLSGGLSYAHVQLPPNAAAMADQKDVDSIVAMYGKIEEALAKEDIDAIMAFYADDYAHQGITKSVIRNLWSSIFANFDNLNSTHAFSAVKVAGDEARVTCTGTLLGMPKGSKDQKVVAVDRWESIDHFLTKKGGSWKIVGGASHWLIEPRVEKYGEDVKYQLEFHPLF